MDAALFIAVLGAAVIVTGAWLLKMRIKLRSEEQKLSLENAGRRDLSREETKRLQIVTAAMSP